MNFHHDNDNRNDKHSNKHHDKHFDCDCDKHYHDKKDSCVEETLRKIAKAQHEAEEHAHHHHHNNRCKSGCNQAIEELLNPQMFVKTDKKNTIPVILYMKDGCPFKAEGVKTYHCDCCKDKKFKCFSTFVFRVSEIKHDCVVLELLTFKHNHKGRKNCHDFCSPCDQIDGEKVKDLIRTGICINVDLNCFCAVSCLPALHLKPRHPKSDC